MKHNTIQPDENWRREAACRDTDPGLFFPVGSTGPAVEQISEAKKICGECAVQATCLLYALESRQDHGIWGGTTEEERRKIQKSPPRSNSA